MEYLNEIIELLSWPAFIYISYWLTMRILIRYEIRQSGTASNPGVKE